MRKEARHTQMRDRASGVHPDILEHLPPKKKQSLPTLLLCALISDLTGGSGFSPRPRPPFPCRRPAAAAAAAATEHVSGAQPRCRPTPLHPHSARPCACARAHPPRACSVMPPLPGDPSDYTPSPLVRVFAAVQGPLCPSQSGPGGQPCGDRRRRRRGEVAEAWAGAPRRERTAFSRPGAVRSGPSAAGDSVSAYAAPHRRNPAGRS